MKFLVAGELNLDLILQNYLSFPALGQETLVEDITLTLGSSGERGDATAQKVSMG